VQALREQHPNRYEEIANQVEPLLDQELPKIKPADLGRIDTFRAEEELILAAAVTALVKGEWRQAREWAEDRPTQTSFWLRRRRQRRVVWSLVADAAMLGCDAPPHPANRMSCGFHDLVATAARAVRRRKSLLFCQSRALTEAVAERLGIEGS
jgi:hypothetical protein